jgi:hypothetical protein
MLTPEPMIRSGRNLFWLVLALLVLLGLALLVRYAAVPSA